MAEDFIPVFWDEQYVPEEAASYSECEVCSAKSRVIWGEGNPRARIAFILDNPGAREDKNGNKYICPTRIILQYGLHKAGIPLNEVYVTYLLKCRPLKRYNKEKARCFSKPFLETQIKKINPDFLVILGDVVVSTLTGDNKASVKQLRGKWQEIMGFNALISYHPLAVRRRPNLREHFFGDLAMLALRYKSHEIAASK